MKENKRFTRIIPRSIENYLVKLRQGKEYLDYGRSVISIMVDKYVNDNNLGFFKILDIGAGGGVDLQNIKKKLKNKNYFLYGIDNYKPNVDILKANGIDAYSINIEREKFPFEDHTMDIVIANQIIEHTKDIFFICSEISRIVKKEGIVIIGFPNLAALHNRILLLLGEQPTCIRMPGPHVRGITKGAFYQFITTDGYFEVEQIAGSNFYPFPPWLAKALAFIFPSFSISLFFLCRRTNKNGNFIDVLNTRFYETNYFKGHN